MPVREVKQLDAEVQQELRDYALYGLEVLGFTVPNVEPRAIVQRIDEYVDEWQDKTAKRQRMTGPNEQEELLNLALGLGVLWGMQLVRQLGWIWTCVAFGDAEFYAVCSPTRSLIVYPQYFVRQCLDDPQLDCTILLAFSMLADGKVPPLPDNGFENLMLGVFRVVPKPGRTRSPAVTAQPQT
jgi:hypothetical protein